MTPETITVSKIEDLSEVLRLALSDVESILDKIDKGDISPEVSASIINQSLFAIFSKNETSEEIVEFLSKCVPARTMQEVFLGIWKLAENIQP